MCLCFNAQLALQLENYRFAYLSCKFYFSFKGHLWSSSFGAVEIGEFLFYMCCVHKSMFQAYGGNKSGPEIIEPKDFLDLGTDSLGLCLAANAGD